MTALVVPGGVMINYLARTPNPTPFLNFMPPEAIMFGDGAWAAAVRERVPEIVLVVPRNTAEYGRGPFGVGCGKGLMSTIQTGYRFDRALRIDGIQYEIAGWRKYDP